jgi:hypothetical protein
MGLSAVGCDCVTVIFFYLNPNLATLSCYFTLTGSELYG